MIAELFLAGIGGIGVGVISYFFISKYFCKKDSYDTSGMKNKFITNISCCRSEGHVEGMDSSDGAVDPNPELKLESIEIVNEKKEEVNNAYNRN